MLIILAFGFFSTTGHIISSVQVLPTPQVELSLGKKSTFDELGLSFFKTYSLTSVKNTRSHSSLFDINYLISYNNLISVKHESITKKLNSLNPISHFTQLKRIPQNSDEPIES